MEENIQQPVPKRKKQLAIGAAILVVIFAIGSFVFLRVDLGSGGTTQNTTQVASERITYQGEEGVNALTLLKEHAEVEEENGFVISINGYRATEENSEYWAFYLNGELAQIGANQYVTKDSDEIVWKIEQY